MRWVVIALVVFTTHEARADPSKNFIAAQTVFRAGQYKEAAVMFGGLLYPTMQLRDQQEVIDAHLHLAVANFEIGQRDAAGREFVEALKLDPTLDISKYGFSREATDFFQEKRQEYDKKARAAAEQIRKARERKRAFDWVERIRITERKNYVLNLVPFGVGQFQNDQKNKGIFFAATQAGFGGASFVIWIYLRGRYPDGQVPLEEVDQARTLQIFQITSALLCVGSMTWGVADALANYKDELRPLTPQEKKEWVDEYIREEREDKESALRITPMITPDSAGAALSWEF